MIRLALTDLDSTLIPYGQGMASPLAIAGLRAANAAPGVMAGPITGRTCAMMSWLFGSATECWDTGVLVNGQVVRLRGETILRTAPSREVLDALSAYLREREGEGVALTLYDEEVDDNVICVGITSEEMERHPRPFAPFSRCAPRVPEGVFVKTNIHCARTHDEAKAIRDDLALRFPELSFVFPSPTTSTIDITPAGVTKLTGLELLMDELGVTLDEVCIFGDGDNDLSVIEAATNSVAVANSCDAVAHAARWHIGPCADDSVAQALFDIAEAAHAGALPAFMKP